MTTNTNTEAGIESTSPSCSTLWTIASETMECYGHGDHGTEQRITREGAYGTGEFPPCFESKGEAQSYLDGLKWNHDKKVVALRFFLSVERSG